MGATLGQPQPPGERQTVGRQRDADSGHESPLFMEPSQPLAEEPPPPQPTIPSLARTAPSGQVQQAGTQPPAGQGGAAAQVTSTPMIARAGAPTTAAPAFVISNTGQLIAARPTQALPPAIR